VLGEMLTVLRNVLSHTIMHESVIFYTLVAAKILLRQGLNLIKFGWICIGFPAETEKLNYRVERWWSVVERPWLKNYDAGVPASIEYPAVPLFHFLEEAAMKYPQQPCTVFRDDAISYGAMNSAVNRLAAALQNMGVTKGTRVGVLLPNIPQFVLAFYAILKAGGIVVAMNPLYKQRELEFQAGDAQVDVLICLENAYELLNTVRAVISLRAIILTRLEDAFLISEWGSSEAADQSALPEVQPGDSWLRDVVLSQSPGASASVDVTADDVAVFQYSGGTTGTPKGAVALHRNLVANSLMFRHWLIGLEEGRETTLMAIPMYHVYGMVVGMSVSILLGASMVLIPDPRNLNDLLRNVETYKASFFPGVPTMYAIINQFPEVKAGKYNLQSIRACISGSAPLLKEVQETFEHLTKAHLMEGYGLSEAPTATHCNPMFGEKRTGSIGLPLPDVDCQIVSLEDGETVLPPGEIGELVLRSPQVMQEYHNRPEETEETLRGGWLHTGDIARMDADGYFYIVDRKKELIKVSGFQVWPREIEEVITAHPAVREASVAGIPDAIRGEAAKAWVVLKPGQHVTAEALIGWCEKELIYYKVPVQIQFRESLPRTNVGKVLRRELVREHKEGK
jgi:long-chain acyl-CoA synthetase